MNLRTRVIAIACLAVGLASMLSCNFPLLASLQQSTPTATEAPPTQAPSATPTVQATKTPVPPTATDTPTPLPQPTATVGCEDSSLFVSDITISDNTVMKPGQNFTKTWRLRNSGDCEWTSSFAVVFVNGSAMGGPAAVPLATTVASNGTVDISINLTAPTTNGIHRGNYQMRDASDALFGVVFYVQIVVGPTPTPTSGGNTAGQVTIDNGGSVDFDSGTSPGNPRRDVWVHYVSDSERYLEPVNGALLKQMSGAPSRSQCEAASLSGSAVSFTDFGSGSYFCYKTSGGRYGRFEVEKIEADSIGFDFRTWD